MTLNLVKGRETYQTNFSMRSNHEIEVLRGVAKLKLFVGQSLQTFLNEARLLLLLLCSNWGSEFQQIESQRRQLEVDETE